MPHPPHERYQRWTGRFVETLTESLDIEICSLSACTWSRKDLAKGVEADECYYIQNEAVIRGRMDIDLTIDPPPDLAIEIDITSLSLPRLHRSRSRSSLPKFSKPGSPKQQQWVKPLGSKHSVAGFEKQARSADCPGRRSVSAIQLGSDSGTDCGGVSIASLIPAPNTASHNRPIGTSRYIRGYWGEGWGVRSTVHQC
jgi:hypothetical protein